jgi:hypothetical protein
MSDLWEEYTTWVPDDRFPDGGIPVCGLCGNSGLVNTLTTAKFFGRSCGVQGPCICPNGRRRKADGR